MNMKQLWLVILAMGLSPMAWSDDTYGYLGFWRDTRMSSPPHHTKTTTENATETVAQNEWQQFCRQQNQLLPENQNGCFGETVVRNQCVAASFANKWGALSPRNVFIVVGNGWLQVQRDAQAMCEQAAGADGLCEVETAFCSDSNLYAE